MSEAQAIRPHAGPQSEGIALRKIVEELFFGGSRGPGKTYFLLLDFLRDIQQGAHWSGVLFRRTFPQLTEVERESLKVFPATGGEYKVGSHTWSWPNGATLRLAHLDTVFDASHYQGHQFSWIGFDELPLWPDLMAYKMLKATLRGPALYKRIRATGNPGGPGHQAVMEYFGIKEHPEGGVPIMDPDTGMTRMFLRGRLHDNTTLMEQDPGYEARLDGVGDAELVRAWKDGDWNAVVGSYFSMFRPAVCTVDPFEVPQGWAWYLSMDYGEENPTWCGLLAVNSDDDVYVVDEYYRGGCGGADHARGIAAMVDSHFRLRKDRVRTFLAPHDMWVKRKPGEASQAASPKDTFSKLGVHLTRANMDRVNGWRNLKDLLYAGRLKFFRGRTEHVISSLSSVMRDPHNPEDVLKGGDDHPADGLRYGINHVYRPRKQGPQPPENAVTAASVLKMLEAMGQPEGRYG